MIKGQGGAFFAHYKNLIDFQLTMVAKASANLLLAEPGSGQKQDDVFYLAVRTLNDMLIVEWDNDHKNKQEAAIKEQSPHKLLQACILLIRKRKILKSRTRESLLDIENEGVVLPSDLSKLMQESSSTSTAQ